MAKLYVKVTSLRIFEFSALVDLGQGRTCSPSNSGGVSGSDSAAKKDRMAPAILSRLSAGSAAITAPSAPLPPCLAQGIC